MTPFIAAGGPGMAQARRFFVAAAVAAIACAALPAVAQDKAAATLQGHAVVGLDPALQREPEAQHGGEALRQGVIEGDQRAERAVRRRAVRHPDRVRKVVVLSAPLRRDGMSREGAKRFSRSRPTSSRALRSRPSTNV